MRFCRVAKPALSWTPSILQLIFFHFVGYKIRFLPSRETQGSKLPSIVWANFTHFGILKMWFLTIHETNISRYLAMSGNFLNFWGQKCVLLSREIHVSRVTSFVWVYFPCYQFLWKHFQHFRSLKMRFLPIRETNVLRNLAKIEETSFIFHAYNALLSSSETHVSTAPQLRVCKFSACTKLPHFGSLKMRLSRQPSEAKRSQSNPTLAKTTHSRQAKPSQTTPS